MCDYRIKGGTCQAPGGEEAIFIAPDHSGGRHVLHTGHFYCPEHARPVIADILISDPKWRPQFKDLAGDAAIDFASTHVVFGAVPEQGEPAAERDVNASALPPFATLTDTGAAKDSDVAPVVPGKTLADTWTAPWPKPNDEPLANGETDALKARIKELEDERDARGTGGAESAEPMPDALATLVPQNLDLLAQKVWAAKRLIYLYGKIHNLKDYSPAEYAEWERLTQYQGWFN